MNVRSRTSCTAAGFALFASMLVGACADPEPSYATHDITEKRTPAGGTFALEGSRIPLGGVIQAKIIARDSDGARMRTSVRSDQPTVVDLLLVDGAADTYLVLGRHVGATTISLLASDRVVRTIPIQVIDVAP